MKYYFFNGQPVAMLRGSNLYDLHADHLGSTVLTTYSSSATVAASQQYCAYGKKRNGTSCTSGNALFTDKHFTGQKYDSTGLHYYRARYYDDHLGQFISPDTLVPDVGNVFSYNRFLYSRGNPLNRVDPSGHCDTSVQGQAMTKGNLAEHQCWTMVDSIVNVWDETPYWNTRWGSQENFVKNVAPYAANDVAFMRREWTSYQDDKTVRDSQLTQALRQYREYNPTPGRDHLHPCRDVWDCRAISYSLGSLGLSVTGDALAACTVPTAGICGGAAVAVKAMDVTLTAESVRYALEQSESGAASSIDTSISLAVDSVSLLPVAGYVAPIVGLGWNLLDPIVPEEYMTGSGR